MREVELPRPRGFPGSGPAPQSYDAGYDARYDFESDAWRHDRIQAFTVLDDARLLRSYRLATLILRDRCEAEDATQEAIERAWSGWHTLRDVDRFDAWFDRILVNVCRNRLRHGRVIRLVPLDDALGHAAADDSSATIARLLIGPAFARLGPDLRIVVVLRYWLDLSTDEIAERLAVPPGTVRSRLHYALAALRGAIEASEEAAR